MDRINAGGYILDAAGRRIFRDANLQAGINGTLVDAAWLTGVQEEQARLINRLGAGCDPNNLSQIGDLLMQPAGGPPLVQNTAWIGPNYAYNLDLAFTAPANGYVLVRGWINVGGAADNDITITLESSVAGADFAALAFGHTSYSQEQAGVIPVTWSQAVALRLAVTCAGGANLQANYWLCALFFASPAQD